MDIYAIAIVASFIAGVLVTRAWYRRLLASAETASGLERDIVRAAMQRGGRITALDVRSRDAHSVEVVEQHLRRLHARGYCESDLAHEGHPVYVFSAFDEAPMRALRVEKQILRLARDSGGVVLVGRVAVETDLAFLEARQFLDKMVEDGICAAGGEPDSYIFAPSSQLAAPPRVEPPRPEH